MTETTDPAAAPQPPQPHPADAGLEARGAGASSPAGAPPEPADADASPLARAGRELAHRIADALEAIRARLVRLLGTDLGLPHAADAESAAVATPSGLGGEAPFELGLDAGELDDVLGRKRQLFLGYYTEELAASRLREDGIVTTVERKVGPIEVRVDGGQGLLRLVRVGVDGEDAVVGEVKARLIRHTGGPLPGAAIDDLAVANMHGLVDAPPPPPLPEGRLLWIDWILLQNPLVEASAAGGAAPFRPLPGQRHPGLGVGREVLRVVKRAAWRLGCDAVAATPMYYHNAVMYHRQFAFIDPRAEGLFLALTRDLAPLGMHQAAWAVEQERVHCAVCGLKVRWRGLAMLFPLAQPFRDYLLAPSYVDTAAMVLGRARFEASPAAEPAQTQAQA